MIEKQFDYKTYINKRLKEIDDLEERRFAKELLLESLGNVLDWTEKKYKALEERVQKELAMPWEQFYTYTTVIDEKDYDPIHTFWFPVCQEDIEEIKERNRKTIYLAADKEKCQRFLDMEVLTGIERETGKRISFQICQAKRYEEKLKKLHNLFISNHIPWQTVHMGHLERFFDLIPMEEESSLSLDVQFQWGEWEKYVREGKLPLWNMEKIQLQSREYRRPCIDDVFYEHMVALPKGKKEEGGCLVETLSKVLSIRYEEDKIFLKTREESIEEIFLYQLKQNIREGEEKGEWVLSNAKKDTLCARYVGQVGNVIQTPGELYRKVEEMSGDYKITIEHYEIREKLEGKIVKGDMNEYTGASLFEKDKRRVLYLHIQKEEGREEDYLYEAQVRYMLSQLQREFQEYKWIGGFE